MGINKHFQRTKIRISVNEEVTKSMIIQNSYQTVICNLLFIMNYALVVRFFLIVLEYFAIQNPFDRTIQGHVEFRLQILRGIDSQI